MNTAVRRTLALTALVTLLVPAGLLAAKQRPGPGPRPIAGASPGFLLQRAIERLELTPEQLAEIRAIFRAHAGDLTAAVGDVAEARRAMFAAIHAPTFDEHAIRSAAAVVGGAEAELAIHRASLVQEVRAVLTPEQQAELEAMIAEARERIEALLALILDRLGEV